MIGPSSAPLILTAVTQNRAKLQSPGNGAGGAQSQCCAAIRPELLNRYNTDAAFRQSVDVRLQYTNENVALAYYQGWRGAQSRDSGVSRGDRPAHRAGKLDRLTPLEERTACIPNVVSLCSPPGIAPQQMSKQR